MKWLFFVFLVANLLVFGLSNLGGGNAIDPRGREINASQMQIMTGQLVTPKKASAASDAASVPANVSTVVASSVAPAAAPVPVAASVVVSASPPVKLVCLRWSGFSIEQATAARSRLKSLGLVATESGGAENAKAWVYIPPLESLDAARKKAQQIAELGVEDYFVVNNGSKWQFAISLGVFSTREAGERRLAELKNLGVRSAVVRDKDDTLKPVTFTLKNVSEADRQKLDKLGQQFRGVELRTMSCR